MILPEPHRYSLRRWRGRVSVLLSEQRANFRHPANRSEEQPVYSPQSLEMKQKFLRPAPPEKPLTPPATTATEQPWGS
jgi:hypothetical protein